MSRDFNDCAFDGSSARSAHGSVDGEKGIHAHLFPDLSDDGPSDELEVIAVNLRPRGIGLDLMHDVLIGAVYNIEIAAGDHKAQSQVRITSCDLLADGRYRAGGEYC